MPHRATDVLIATVCAVLVGDAPSLAADTGPAGRAEGMHWVGTTAGISAIPATANARMESAEAAYPDATTERARRPALAALAASQGDAATAPAAYASTRQDAATSVLVAGPADAQRHARGRDFGHHLARLAFAVIWMPALPVTVLLVRRRVKARRARRVRTAGPPPPPPPRDGGPRTVAAPFPPTQAGRTTDWWVLVAAALPALPPPPPAAV